MKINTEKLLNQISNSLKNSLYESFDNASVNISNNDKEKISSVFRNILSKHLGPSLEIKD